MKEILLKIDLGALFLSKAGIVISKEEGRPFCLELKQNEEKFYHCQWCSIKYMEKTGDLCLRDGVSVIMTDEHEFDKPVLCLGCKLIVDTFFTKDYWDEEYSTDRLREIYEMVGDVKGLKEMEAVIAADSLMDEFSDGIVHYDTYCEVFNELAHDKLVDYTSSQDQTNTFI